MARDAGSMPMDEPLAFFLTWTTYGSWLPGDQRGWVRKPGQFMAPDPRRESESRARMTEPEVTLDGHQREVVEHTIAEHCRVRGWRLHAVACRTQHVHVVVTAPDCNPEDVMRQFKAWSTRRLKEQQLKPEAQAKAPSRPHFAVESRVREKWWTEGGSRRSLYDEDSLAAAVGYVLEGQDPWCFGCG